MIFGEDNRVLYSDFPIPKSSAAERTHLLDVFSGVEREHILRVIGVALDRIGQEIGTYFKVGTENWNVRVICSNDKSQEGRTHIFILRKS